MKQIYYLLALLLFCAPISFAQNCNDLEILTTTPGSVCGPGSVTLASTASGTGDDIYWYDAATAGTYLGKGSTFQTPSISSTSSYWATEVIATGITLSGEAKLDPTGTTPGGYTLTAGLEFTATDNFTLVEVTAYSYSTGGTIPSIQLQDASGTMLQEVTNITVPPGGSGANMAPFTIPLNFTVAPGTYRLMTVGTHASLARDSGATNAAFPHAIGPVGSITGGILTSSAATSYYYFYNWTISTGTVTCESPREEVVATVNNIADEDILALPYTHTANTATYFNNYSGAPGTNCGTTNDYLYGNDVVYKYTANDDYILNVQLSGLSESFTGVFIYNSCTDIGATCASIGSIGETTADHGFQVSVVNGNSYYFVVSSAEPTDSFTYTLTINGTTCTNYPAPTGAAAQNFITGQTLADLQVTGPNITWYDDAAKTTVLPANTTLVDATTYYATQSFQGCEGAVLAVAVTEIQCTALGIQSSTGGSVCGEGSVTLTAQGMEPATNTALFWYANATGGDKIGTGTEFQTPKLEQTTSYWVSEVALSGALMPGGSGPLPTYCVPTFGTGCTSSDTIDNFIIEGPTGASVLSHIGSGCSPNGYGNFTADSSLNPTFEAGETYNFTVTSGYTNQRLKIWIDLNKDGVFDDVDELLFASPAGANPTIGTFTIPADAEGTITGMRVFNNFSSIPTDACTTTSSFGEVHDYKVTIVGTSSLCESSRTEVIATVNNIADELVTEPLPFVHTENTSNYGNNYQGEPGGSCNDGTLYLNGNDVVYQYSPTVGGIYKIELSGLSSNNAAVFVYESCFDIGTGCYAGAVNDGTTGNISIDEVPLYDGFDYFIVISTSVSSSTAYTLTIDLATINCADYTAAPDGDANQFFEAGDTLADLVVRGGNLTWYSDAAGTLSIPVSTLLVDGDTYYVKQTLNACDSALLAITVTKIDCSALEIVSTIDGTIVCKGVTQLEAVGNGGLGTDIYWYNTPTGGDPIAFGPTYTTPQLTSTTSYWVSEVFLEQGAGSNTMPSPCVPVHGSSGCSGGDNIDNFTLSQVGGPVLINHIGTGCSTGNYGNYIADSNYTATLLPNTDYDVAITHTYQTSNWVKIWIDFDFDGTFDETTELVFQSTTGSTAGQTNGTFNVPANVLGSNTIMRVSTRFSALPDNACQIGGTYGETHDYKVTIIGAAVLCESTREEVIATVSQDGDIIVPPALPYIDANNSTSNYGNTFSAAPGTSCGTTENYLNGDEVVYMYTPTQDDLIDIHLKDISGFYAGLFVYESCGDIGTNCSAGVVAGPSDDDISIKEFTVLNGQTYYIVVSSWLTQSIGYTLEINGFVCSAFPAPIGDAVQDYAAPAVLSDLVVAGTMSSSVLNWYSDPLGTQGLPPNTPLVNGTTYYVSQTHGTCESPLLAILVQEIDCSDLDIISTVDGSVACIGSMTLQAVSGGFGSDIYWYDAQTAGNLVGTGSTYTTPVLTNTTSYWVTEVHLEQGSGSNVMPTPCTPIHGSSGCSGGDNIDNFILSQGGSTLINHIGTGCSANDYGNYISDPNLTATLVANTTYDVAITHTYQTSNWVKIWIDFDFDGNFDENTELVFQSSTGSSGGQTNGTFNIPSNVLGSNTIMRVSTRFSGVPDNACTIGGTYGETHDYKVIIVGSSALCEAPRVEVIATVDQAGDKLVGPLNYTDSDSTINYGNNFSGTPGCGFTGNYLDGNAVVYRYSPATDDIVNIELTGVTNNSAGVFVYQSCGDVGTNCLAGTVNNGGIYLIEEFYATGGQEYFIVVTSEAGSTSYTLNIYGFDCVTNLDTPTGDATQYFVGTKYLSDLDVDEHQYSTGLTWYSDAAGTQSIPEATTTLIHNTTYYVAQTVLGCESDLLAITAMEFDCTDMEITTTTSGTVCQSGNVTLTAQASGVGSDIYWFSSPTDPNPIFLGNTFITPTLTSTTSYWVTEVYTEQGSGGNAMPTPCTPIHGSSGCSGGDNIDNFVLSQGGSTLISHIGTGCSANNYGNFISDPNLTATLVANATYNVAITHTYQTSNWVKIWIDFNFDGNFDENTELVFQSTTGSSGGQTNGTFSIPPSVLGSNTIMRVSTRFSALPGNACTIGGTFGETHDYKVIVVGSSTLCEAPRIEVVAEVNNTLPLAPTGDAIQHACGSQSTIADLVVLGDNIKWYNANGSQLSLTTQLQDGESYFATQTVASCEGPSLEITVELLDKSTIPVADRNQTFYNGETLANLDVIGTDLLWYADLDRMIPLPDSTLLVDQTTYYVSQTETGFCESDLFAITVHRLIGVNDPAFDNVLVLPNPVSDRLTITNNGPIESVELYNLLGQRVAAQSAGMQREMVMDVSFLSSGTYLLNVKIDGKTGIFKVIKE